MALPAVQLDDPGGSRPVAVDLVALGTEDDPVVEAGQGQAVTAEEGREALLQLRALAARWFFFQALKGKADLPRAPFEIERWPTA
jgi:hypothetical protein